MNAERAARQVPEESVRQLEKRPPTTTHGSNSEKEVDKNIAILGRFAETGNCGSRTFAARNDDSRPWFPRCDYDKFISCHCLGPLFSSEAKRTTCTSKPTNFRWLRIVHWRNDVLARLPAS